MSGCRHLGFEGLVALVFFLGVEAVAAESLEAEHVSRRSTSWVTEVLADKLPKYVANPPDETIDVAPTTEAVEGKDGTLYMPTMKVRPIIKESASDYALLTPKGRLDLARKRHPGLRIGNIFGMNNGIALAMMQEEMEVEKRNALKAAVERVSLNDDPGARELKRLLQDALIHPNTDWLKSRPGKRSRTE